MQRKKQKTKKNRRNGGYNVQSARSYTSRDRVNLTWFDPHRYITLRYTDGYSFTLTATTASSQIMNLNSVFDPDRTGAGHQPMGFDTLATIYNRYRVLKTKWKTTWSPSSLTYHLCVLPLNGALNTAVTTAATFNACVENPRSKYWTMGASGQSKRMAGSCSLNDIAGTTRAEFLADDRYESSIAGSPSELMELVLAAYNPNASTITLYFYLEMDFEVDFHDPISQPQS